MDLSQATQMLTWLDEQRRQDKRELEELREQVKKQAEHIADLNKRLEESEGRFVSLQAQLQVLSRLGEALEQVKGDVVMTLRSWEEGWKKQAEAEVKSRRADLERLNRSLSEATKEARELWKADLSAHTSELNRQAESLTRLKALVEDLAEKARRTPDKLQALEAQLRQLTSDNQRLMELAKRVDKQAAKLSALEEREQRISQVWADLTGFRGQVEKELSRLIQQQRASDEQNEKRFQGWVEEMERQLQRIRVWESDQKKYVAHHEESERTLSRLQELERLASLRLSELAEVQRLGAERLDAQLGELRTSEERRWAAHKQETELARREQGRTDEAIRAELGQLKAALQDQAGQLADLRQALGSLFLDIFDRSEEIAVALGTGSPRRRRRGRKPSEEEMAAAAAADVRVWEGDQD